MPKINFRFNIHKNNIVIKDIEEIILYFNSLDYNYEFNNNNNKNINNKNIFLNYKIKLINLINFKLITMIKLLYYIHKKVVNEKIRFFQPINYN